MKKAINPDLKTISVLDASPTRETAIASTPITVCMHVLGTASTDTRVMRAATALVTAGYAVSIIDIEEGANQQKEGNIDGVCVKHIMVSRSFLSTRFDRWTLVRLAQLFVRSVFRVILTPADIYHPHDVSALPACYIAARLRRKPVVFDAHEMPLFERPLAEMGRSRRWLQKLLGILLAHMVPRCAGVITVSPPIVKELRQRYGVAEVTLVRNIPEYQEVPKSDRLRQHLGLKPEVRIALYHGHVQLNRGLDRLVRAAAFLESKIVIVIMGKSVGGTQAQLEALIASEGVAGRVIMLPPVPYAELLDWSGSADIGVSVASPDYSLNVKYFLPNKLFEYLMAGLPMLTSPLEAIVDIVNTYDVGQVLSSLEPAAIGEAINSMLADPVKLARQRSNALKAARNDFYWEKESLQLIHLYQSISPTKAGKSGSNRTL